jgi:ABC-type uncharacterized transport system permease subunit
MDDYSQPSDFRAMLGEFGKWALIIGFLVWIYRSRDARLLGWVVGGVVLIIAIYRELNTGLGSGEFFAVAAVILGTCITGRFNDGGR